MAAVNYAVDDNGWPSSTRHAFVGFSRGPRRTGKRSASQARKAVTSTRPFPTPDCFPPLPGASGGPSRGSRIDVRDHRRITRSNGAPARRSPLQRQGEDPGRPKSAHAAIGPHILRSQLPVGGSRWADRGGPIEADQPRRTDRGRPIEADRPRRTDRGGPIEADRSRQTDRGGRIEAASRREPGFTPVPAGRPSGACQEALRLPAPGSNHRGPSLSLPGVSSASPRRRGAPVPMRRRNA